VQWEAEADRVRLVATDSRRLAVADVPADAPAGQTDPARWLLPASALDLLGRLAGGPDGSVRVAFGAREALFEVGAATLRARYVTGAFPPWRKALPGAPRFRVPVRVGPFLKAVRQAAAVRDPRGGRLLLRFEPGRLFLESRRAGQGRARVRRRLPSSGAAVELTLRATYLVELLAALEPEMTLVLGVTGPGAPVTASDGRGYRHLLMPLGPA
jgi:DNA polymerase-3 subunit beta